MLQTDTITAVSVRKEIAAVQAEAAAQIANLDAEYRKQRNESVGAVRSSCHARVMRLKKLLAVLESEAEGPLAAIILGTGHDSTEEDIDEV